MRTIRSLRTLSLCLLLAACAATPPAAPPPSPEPSPSSEAASTSPAPQPAPAPQPEPSPPPQSTPPTTPPPAPPPTAQVRVIVLTASNWQFSPSAIRVKRGEKVILRIVGQEGVHGFKIAELGINQTIDLGKTVDIALPTDTAGTFEFFCSVPCGSGHKQMRGTIVIE